MVTIKNHVLPKLLCPPAQDGFYLASKHDQHREYQSDHDQHREYQSDHDQHRATLLY